MHRLIVIFVFPYGFKNNKIEKNGAQHPGRHPWIIIKNNQP